MIFIRLFCKTLAIMPLSLNRFLGTLLGYILYLIPKTKARRVVEQNIMLCFTHLNTKEQQRLVKQSLIESGKYSLENCFIWNRSFVENKKYILEYEGLELLKSDKPTILLTPHFGGFEITGRIISLERPVHFLYRSAKNPAMDKLIFNYRNQQDLIMHNATFTGIKNMTSALKRGELIGILPDQNPSGFYERTLFLNVPTYTTTLLSKLAIKYRTTVLLTYALRMPKGYKLILKEVDIYASTLEKSMQKMQDVIAELVLKHPEQYMWNYKKFKRTVHYK